MTFTLFLTVQAGSRFLLGTMHGAENRLLNMATLCVPLWYTLVAVRTQARGICLLFTEHLSCSGRGFKVFRT